MQPIAPSGEQRGEATATLAYRASSARRRPARRSVTLLGEAGVAGALASSCGGGSDDAAAGRAALVAQGQQVFRFDTFGDETPWTDTLRMHEVIRTAVDPTTALSVGLKVDAQALPAAVVAGIQNGSVDLKSPATTVALLKLDAVVGLKGTVETIKGVDVLTRVGVTCALCHSTVDDSLRCPPRSAPRPRRSTTPGARASTTRASTSTARTARRSSRPPTAWRTSTRSLPPATATTWRTGTVTSA